MNKLVTEGHYRTLKFMNSDEFVKIKNIYERKENNEILGGVYFRPVEDKVTAVDLAQNLIKKNQIKPLIGIGNSYSQYIKLSDTENSIEKNISSKIDELKEKRNEIEKGSKEKVFEAFLINEAQSNGLKFNNIHSDLRFIHSQWRVSEDNNSPKYTDLIAVDIKNESLVIIELKYKKDSKADDQLRDYIKFFNNNFMELTQYFLEVAKTMGRLYNCKELQTLENLSGEIYGFVSWPNKDGDFANLFVKEVKL
ncbi:MAG: hypothetical protein ABRQ27_05180 [Clostridiaceae bacterium]